MPRLTNKYPSYRLHRSSGQGIATLDGKDYYCGPFQDPASRERYDGFIALWLVHGGQINTRVN